MNPAAAPLPSPQMLEGVAAAWRRDVRIIETAFGGDSMRPAILPGQRVTLDCGRDPVVGEVAVFRIDGQVGVHRLVRRGADWMLTWGDANGVPDGPLRIEQTIGTLRDIPRAPRRWWRSLLLAWLAPPAADFELVRRRVATAHGALRAWRAGPRVFLSACWRRLVRPTETRPRPTA